MTLLTLSLTTGCSNKNINCEPYKNFTILDKPKPIKLKIKSDKIQIDEILVMLNRLEVDETNVQLKNDINKKLVELYNNDTKLNAITKLKIKSKVLEKIVEEYETDINDYLKWIEK